MHLDQRFRQLGPMTEAGYKRVPVLRGLPLEDAFAGLARDGVLVACTIDGVRGTWYVHRDLVDPARPFRGRTTLLSPFDPLVYDRTRARELWAFRHKLEIYAPPGKREFGYFVLPILHRERLVGRIDPLFDRKTGVLRVSNVYAEEDATEDAAKRSRRRSRSSRAGSARPTSTTAASHPSGGVTSADAALWSPQVV